MTQVEDVCVLVGPGYGECWGCPVRECVLWKDPGAALSVASMDVALRAFTKIEAGVVQLTVDHPLDLLTGTEEHKGLMDREVQDDLNVNAAAEAVVLGIVPGIEERETRVYRDWIAGLKGREPTPDDSAHLDDLLLRCAADASARRYGAPVDAVARRLAFLRGFKLRPTRAARRMNERVSD